MDPFGTRGRAAMTHDDAERIAIAALAFIGSDETSVGRFFALTGYSAESIRAAATDPAFLAGVMRHIVEYEPLLLDFAGHQRIRPEEVVSAARELGIEV